MNKLPEVLERLLKQSGAKGSAMLIIRSICHHWRRPERYETNLRQLIKNDDGKLFHQAKPRGKK